MVFWMLKKHKYIRHWSPTVTPTKHRQILGWLGDALRWTMLKPPWLGRAEKSHLDLEHCRNEVSLRKALAAASEGMQTPQRGWLSSTEPSYLLWFIFESRFYFGIAHPITWFRLHPITSSMYNIYCQLPHLSKVTRGTCIQSNCPFAIHDLNQNSIWKWVKTLMPCSSHVRNRQNGPGVNTTILVGRWV